MSAINNNVSADNLIKLVTCLKTINTDKTRISFYAEKMSDKDGNIILY